jgi:uncharacterized protein
MTDTTSPLSRRRFLHGALGTGAGLALAGPFAALGARTAGAAPARMPTGVGYGPLAPAIDQTTGLELLLLPQGFEYMSFGWTNDVMSDGVRTPSNHDGMAAFRDGDIVRLVRNHERGTGTPFATADATYDSRASGGTTNLVFDPDAGEFLDNYASLSGTIRNCAGGPTPRGTWLTCEETTEIVSGTRHGYVFEVPSDGRSNAEPIIGMGRFSHEANATDPATGIVYLTEDSGNSALYRYVPSDPDNLAAGGVLQAMVLDGTTDTLPWATGQSAAASWVLIDSPDFGPGEPSPGQQARAKGSARISRGEGCWYGNGVIYVISTDGATTRQGQVFAYDPVGSTFTCVFASPAANVLNNPDNVTVSPRGGLVLCEDGSGREFLHGLTPDGEIFPFAENNIVLPPEFQQSKGYSGDFRGSEWAGATFEPKNGNWLFANIQSPGVTFAITGPWRRGTL